VELLASIIVVGILAAFGIKKYGENQEKVRVNAAIMELQGLQMQLATMDPLPASLAEIGRGTMKDPWGNLYVYNRFTQFAAGVPVGARRDRNLRPINADFDLYSVGKDGVTTLALTAKNSEDDVVVANDGKFVGLAKDY
jgi:general secretion pathway protein G